MTAPIPSGPGGRPGAADGQNPPDTAVSGETRKVRTHDHAEVAWAGEISEEVDVYRDGDILATTQDDGSHPDQFARTARPSAHVDPVCAAGGTVCSDELRLGFGASDHPDRQLPVLVTNG